jgi:carbamoyltransferase
MSTIIVGLNMGHDAGVSMLVDGQVIFAANEERFSRKKNHIGFPVLALNFLIENFHPKVDFVAVEGLKVLPLQVSKREGEHGVELQRLQTNLFDNLGITKYFWGSKLGILCIQNLGSLLQLRRRAGVISSIKGLFGQDAEVVFQDHHKSHIASSVFGFADKADGIALSFDASGEGFCSKVALITNGSNLDFIDKFNLPSFWSPANIYKNVTDYLGFVPLRHEGKITGLAAYGDPAKCSPIFNEYYGFNAEKGVFYNKFGYDNAKKVMAKLFSENSKEDVAAGVQDNLEETLIRYINFLAHNISPRKKISLYLSGGLFANVKLNQKIFEEGICEEIFVTPNMGDGGLNLGAAMLVANKFGIPAKIDNPYLCTGNQSDSLESTLEMYKTTILTQKMSTDDLVIAVAQLLSSEKIVAISRGFMEYGPRALGNRSILYQATDPLINGRLNKLLGRTEFMPFAPIIRDVDADRFFKLKNRSDIYEYMTITVECHPLAKLEAPAIVHVDNTARPQVLQRYKNQFVYDLLTEYKAQSKFSILVNTSFNMHEEPIVRTYKESIESFLRSGIDYLVLENYLIQRIGEI